MIYLLSGSIHGLDVLGCERGLPDGRAPRSPSGSPRPPSSRQPRGPAGGQAAHDQVPADDVTTAAAATTAAGGATA